MRQHSDTSLPRLAAEQVRLRRELVAEFHRLLLDSDSATCMLRGWLDTAVTVHVTRHSEAYEPTCQQRRQLLFYQPAGLCWKRVAQLATANGARISEATGILIPERLDPWQAAAVRAGQVPLGDIWSTHGVKRHTLDVRSLRDSVFYNLDDPFLEVTARLTMDGLPAALIIERYFEDFLYVHPRWVR